MRFAEELELSEIAAITHIPVNTVKTHLHRALKSVRTQVRAAQSATPEDAPAPQRRRRARTPQRAAAVATSQPAGETS